MGKGRGSRGSRNKSARQKDSSSGSPEAAFPLQFRSPTVKRVACFCLALTAITLALYWPVLSHPFADYDDDTYVTANAHVQSGLNRHSLVWALTATEQSNWHPLTWISHELDYQLYGLNPAGHHITNLGLHVVNVLLLFVILAFATGAMGRSFLVALLFAIHPLNVESVAWIAERKNVLSTVFFLLAIGFYCWYAQNPGKKRYTLVFLSFLLGLASKPMVITLPCVLLLLDHWPLQRVRGTARQSALPPYPQLPWSRLLLEKAPLFLLSVASAIVTIFAQNAGGALKPLTDLSFGARVENAVYAYAEYFLKVLWPTALAPHYPHPGSTLALSKVGFAAIFLAGTSAWVWRKSSHPYLLVGWCWFLGTLVPVIGLIQVGDQAIADRYMYIPIIGLLIMMVWFACDRLKDKIGLAFQISIAAVIIAPLLFLTHRQIGFWKNSYDLWSHTVEVTENNYVAEDNLGVALSNLGRDDQALVHFYNAERIAPSDPSSHLNAAAILQTRGDIRRALAEYSTAIRIASANPTISANAKTLAVTMANLGTLYSVNGNYEKARENYRQALTINPTALNDLIAKFYRFAAARPEGKRYLWLGEMLEQAGRPGEAREAYGQALRLDPTLAEARSSLERLKLDQNSVGAPSAATPSK